jgi:hypothetical protein
MPQFAGDEGAFGNRKGGGRTWMNRSAIPDSANLIQIQRPRTDRDSPGNAILIDTVGETCVRQIFGVQAEVAKRPPYQLDD